MCTVAKPPRGRAFIFEHHGAPAHVVLCSLTTTLGYLALIGSHNQAIRSLGVVAVIGEISCILAAMLVLPAVWYLVERRRGASDSLRAPRVPKI